MLKVGITGGMGSGKSTVCDIFRYLGIPVYNSDTRARALMIENKNIVQHIIAEFGPDAYLKNGELNRKHISAAAFKDPQKLEKLNSIVHPEVFTDFRNWVKEQHSPYIIKEAALMFESGSYKDVDFVVNVNAPVTLRVARVMERDGLTKEDILRRMRSQWTDKRRTALAQFIIKNDLKHMLIPQVLKLHHLFLEH